MKKYITTGLIVTVSFIGLFFLLSNNQQVNQFSYTSSRIIAESTFYDFGDIDIFGGVVTTSYTLKNIGQEDVHILSAVTSCACTEGEIDGMRFGMHEQIKKTITILAGEEKNLIATFDPLAHGPYGTGRVTRELTLTTDSSEMPEVIVRFTANVVRDL